MTKFAITKPALRIKITGRCNRTCSFCHEEGDMQHIQDVAPDNEFFTCVITLTDTLGIGRIMLTGGEPMLHRQLGQLITGFGDKSVSMTTNGVELNEIATWEALKQAGLGKVIMSIHDATPDRLLRLERIPRTLPWASRALDHQILNLRHLHAAGIPTRVNCVVYGDGSSARSTLALLRSFHQEIPSLELRLLNDLGATEQSQHIITDIITEMGASEVDAQRRAGSSNVTRHFKSIDGFRFSVKVSYPYFLSSICEACDQKSFCFEGFYGLRLERRDSGYYIRLCIYKQSHDVLMPWNDFLRSDLAAEIHQVIQIDE